MEVKCYGHKRGSKGIRERCYNFTEKESQNTYYDAAWTDEYSKFTTEAPLLPDNNPITTPEEEINKSEDDDNKNIDNKPSEENKEIVNKQNIPSQNRENPLLWLLDKIIKFIVKLFRRKK